MADLKPSWWRRVEPGDWIALAALFVALYSVGWQARDAWVGADVRFLSMKARTAELRCHSKSVKTCWGPVQEPSGSEGRLTIVLPVFLSNQGAVNHNAVVDRVTAEVRHDGRGEPIELVANQFWQLVQGGGSQDSRPFVPFVVEGKNANGAELRFAAHQEEHFVDWRKLAIQIVEGRIKEFNVKVAVYLVGEKEPILRSCRLDMTERLRLKLESRMKRRSKQVRLSATCK